MTHKQTAVADEALTRAVSSQALTNYPAIFEGFVAKGIPADDIKPRENVFTFHAWRALGRTVRKGEHGVQVLTYVLMTRENTETGEREVSGKRPKGTTVFHISQTEAL